jgi:hypothetical protein
VDKFGSGWGKWSGGGHLLATDIDELHAMAQQIGLRRSWFQDRTFPHYDVMAGKRLQAIAAGAVAIEIGKTPDGVLMRVPARGPFEGYETYGERMADRRRRSRPVQ